ncbi:acyl carrier protein [Amycolatopsis solani]|uniref:acyl carrier protein n=1 Tax=Amycolatopsis solani TaxID=3028615 RepID=UPI0025B110C6|nr:acyl carrier protein [Amycolatopsis sp. MEP2-6]
MPGHDAERRGAEYELLVATQVVEAFGELGIPVATVEEILENPSLRRRDFARLGLGSLDWIALAGKVEAVTGAELPDRALLEPEHRCVSGWAAALSATT